MLESILNRIAERSQALKEKDAEIEILESVVAHKDTQVAQLIEDGEFRDNRIKEQSAEIAAWVETASEADMLRAGMAKEVEQRDSRIKELSDGQHSALVAAEDANRRADAAESQLLQIAEALRIEVESPEAVAVLAKGITASQQEAERALLEAESVGMPTTATTSTSTSTTVQAKAPAPEV